jgi:hypothetical protein
MNHLNNERDQLNAIKNIEKMAFKIRPLTGITIITTLLLVAQIWFNRDTNSKIDYVKINNMMQIKDSTWAHTVKDVVYSFREIIKQRDFRDSSKFEVLNGESKENNKQIKILQGEVRRIKPLGAVFEHKDPVTGLMTYIPVK